MPLPARLSKCFPQGDIIPVISLCKTYPQRSIHSQTTHSHGSNRHAIAAAVAIAASTATTEPLKSTAVNTQTLNPAHYPQQNRLLKVNPSHKPLPDPEPPPEIPQATPRPMPSSCSCALPRALAPGGGPDMATLVKKASP
jgi:hypothetical protein